MSRALLALIVLGAACGDEDPRYGTVTISMEAPRAELSGQTRGDTPAVELSPGCAGVVDTSGPDHVVVVRDLLKLGISASSEDGPVSLVIERDGDYYCDADNNTGHLPHMQITEPGTYAIRVAALSPGQALAYRLLVAPDDKEEHARPLATTPESLVSVTVTSDPAGAEVRTRTGQVLGVTPAMLEIPRSDAAADGSFAFVVAAPGRGETVVSGKPQGDELVLHGTLRPAGPETVAIAAAESQPIRDFHTAEQHADLDRDCMIQDIEVDVDIHHTYVGDSMVTLRSPAGTSATLHRYRGAARRNLERTYTASDTRALRDFVGENGHGSWVMAVYDNAEADIGSFESFNVRFTCAPAGTTVAAATSPTPGPSYGTSGDSTPSVVRWRATRTGTVRVPRARASGGRKRGPQSVALTR